MDPEARDLRRELTNALRRCTPKQRKWLHAVRASAGQLWGPALKLKYSRVSVEKWLRKESTREVLRLHAEIAALDSDLTAERIQHEYGRLAFSSLKEFYKPDNTFKQPSEWTEDMAASVSELRFNENGGIAAIKLHSKPRALDTTAKIRGVLVEKLKHEHGELRIRDVSDEPLSPEEWERQYGVAPPTGPAKGSH